MKEQIELLYKIFELELAPPFKVSPDLHYPPIYNKRNQKILAYNRNTKRIITGVDTDDSILRKVKSVFNADKLSNDDVYHIAKHLVNWMQDKLSVEIDSVIIKNADTNINITYYKDVHDK